MYKMDALYFYPESVFHLVVGNMMQVDEIAYTYKLM